MNNIELKWEKQESGNLKIIADEIGSCIVINEATKDIENIKTFFREILFKAYTKGEYTQIVLNSNEIEIPEVKSLIVEIIDLCNEEMKLIEF